MYDSHEAVLTGHEFVIEPNIFRISQMDLGHTGVHETINQYTASHIKMQPLSRQVEKATQQNKQRVDDDDQQ